MTVSTSISTLTGVQWTDLDGSGLNSTQTTTQVALVGALSTGSTTITTRLNSLDVSGSYSYTELFPAINTAPYRLGNTNDYVAYATQAEAQAALASRNQPGAASFYNAALGGPDWIYSVGNLGSSRQYHTIGGTWTRSQWRQTGFTDAQILTASQQTWTTNLTAGRPTLDQINTALGLNLSSTTRLSVSAWREIAHKLKAASYLESSKLTTANGGGIKTYGGKWYANGQEVTYLDIIFAVRVNQLFVINNTITDQLTSVQKTNKLIKAANAVSSILSAKSPTNSSGSTNTLDINAALITSAFANGLIKPTYTSYAAACAAINGGAGKIAPYTNEQGELCWARCHASGSWVEYGNWKDSDYNLNTALDWGYVATSELVVFDTTKLKAMFTSSYDKLFDSGGVPKTNSTVSQTDCTTMTTELKSYTSSLESDNQTAQTQLDQYSNKRTETLDDISTIVKGSTNVLSSIGKNFGALS